MDTVIVHLIISAKFGLELLTDFTTFRLDAGLTVIDALPLLFERFWSSERYVVHIIQMGDEGGMKVRKETESQSLPLTLPL